MSDAPAETLEAFAAELAHAAGQEMASALRRPMRVEYKTGHQGAPGGGAPSDPVSEADQAIEHMLRARIAERFPEHAILGEEMGSAMDAAAEQGLVWALDPIDGTTNFVNGLPLFACSIGVLQAGRPLAGAVWCSASHELRPGVYHAHAGGGLRFDGAPMPPWRSSGAVRRRLGTVNSNEPVVRRTKHRDNRLIGSAAIDLALTAAGIFACATLQRPHLWDVAGGVVLVLAAGHEVRLRRDGAWSALTTFATPGRRLAEWRGSLVAGEGPALDEIVAAG